MASEWQVAVLCKIGSIWISKCPRWRVARRERKKRKATYGSSAADSSLGCGQDHPSYPLTLQCQEIPSEELSEHPHYSKTTSARCQAIIRPYTPWEQAWHVHLETSATFPRDNRWVPSMEKVILLMLLLLRHRRVRPYFCAAVSLKPTKNIFSKFPNDSQVHRLTNIRGEKPHSELGRIAKVCLI